MTDSGAPVGASRDSGAGALAPVRAVARLIVLAGLIVLGLFIALAVFPWLDLRGRNAWIERWSGWLLRVCGLHLSVDGSFPPAAGAGEGVLIVANHVSWLDIFVINRLRVARFVAKSEIRDWPVLGTLVSRVGTLFIERGRRHAVQHMLHTVAGHLGKGETVAVFPEGTTSDGRRLLPFHGNLIQAAIVTGSPVVPVGLAFVDAAGRPSEAPLFVGDTAFVTSVWRILSARGLQARVQVLEAVRCGPQAHRSEVATVARERISRALGIVLEDTRPEILSGRPTARP